MSNVIKRKLTKITSAAEILPLLAEMTMQIGGSAETFCQIALIAIGQLEAVIQDDKAITILWHGQIERRYDDLLFCSQIMLPIGKVIRVPEKIVDFFGNGIRSNSIYKERLWKISCNLPLPNGELITLREEGSLLSSALYGILTVISDLKRDMASMTQEMLVTNQGVIAMVEEMGLWTERADSKEISSLLTERLEYNKLLIERLREKDRALQQADRLATIGRLVAGVAHEINNPLTFIKMNAELLPRMLETYITNNNIQANNEVQYQRPISAIIRGVDRIAGIVSGLKFFSRQKQEKKTGVQLCKCLEEAWSLVSSNKDLSRTVEIKMNIEANVMIYGNEQQIEQVLINLLHNALKAIHKHKPVQGLIIVNANLENNDCVVITVIDNGCGITQSAMSSIFEPFYTNGDDNGTGLGLSIVQGIIHEHSGNIGVVSILGQGTTFTIKLPSWRSQEGDK